MINSNSLSAQYALKIAQLDHIEDGMIDRELFDSIFNEIVNTAKFIDKVECKHSWFGKDKRVKYRILFHDYSELILWSRTDWCITYNPWKFRICYMIETMCR